MCTVIVMKGRHPRYPLIVAANRDEYYARAAAPPRIVHEAPRAIAGVDLAKGGSWMGANEAGLFIAITNQRTYGGADPRRASRGEVVIEALAQPDVESVDALLEALDARDYNSFNLIYGDARALRVGYARSDARAIEIEPLDDGLWVVANDRIGSPEFPKAERAAQLVTPLLASTERSAAERVFDDPSWEPLAQGLARALADHDKPPIERVPEPPATSPFDRGMLRELQALCIHTAVYGTRSATVLALEPGRVAHYLFADGPPCRAPFREVVELLNR